MSRYIDADEALRIMRNSQQDNPCEPPYKGIWNTAHECCISGVDAVSTADVVEIVRCKDCKYFGREVRDGKHQCKNGRSYCFEDDYCSYGERKEK